jgi:hypothetical protein
LPKIKHNSGVSKNLNAQIEISIFSVATNEYLNFWEEMIWSAIKHIHPLSQVEWIVLTNRGDDINLEIRRELGPLLKVITISHEPWPYPSLRRFEFISKYKNEFAGNYLMHLDADMVFKSSLDLYELFNSMSGRELTFVRHPGFYRPNGVANKLRFYFGSPKFLFKDLKLYLTQGNLGTWEGDSRSLAFVPRNMRKNYYCGAVWFGKKAAMLEFSSQMAKQILMDSKKNVLAIHNDESHLNSYCSAASNYHSESPTLCFDSTYPQLKGLAPIIEAVNKKVSPT